MKTERFGLDTRKIIRQLYRVLPSFGRKYLNILAEGFPFNPLKDDNRGSQHIYSEGDSHNFFHLLTC